MRNTTLLAAGALALCGFGVGNASAVVYFFDDFEGKTEPLGPPDIGLPYTTSGTTGSPHSLSVAPAPAIGTQSLKLIRETIHNPANTIIRGNEGALVDGAVVEYSWNNQIEHAHRFNAPIQIGLGFVNGGVGRFTFLGVNDPGNGAYFYTDSSGNQIVARDLANPDSSTNIVRPSLNDGGVGEAQTEWDRVRAVFTLNFEEAGDTDFMSATMDLFITVGLTGTEKQVANDVPTFFAQIPPNSDMTPFDDSTVPQMVIQKGGFTGNTYYDNIFIGNPLPIPEPSMMGLGAGFGLLALRRRRR